MSYAIQKVEQEMSKSESGCYNGYSVMAYEYRVNKYIDVTLYNPETQDIWIVTWTKKQLGL